MTNRTITSVNVEPYTISRNNKPGHERHDYEGVPVSLRIGLKVCVVLFDFLLPEARFPDFGGKDMLDFLV